MENFREKSTSGTPQLGFCITYPVPGLIESTGIDWDWFWIDAQHGELDYKDVLACVRACDLVGSASLVRVPSHEPGWIMRALDTGADGVIIPQVGNAEEARGIVKAAKFPPVGNRSFGGRRVIDRNGREYVYSANEDTLVMAQIETPDAVTQADDIAAVEGIDILLVGPDDVSLTQGNISMTDPKPMDSMREFHEPVANACKKHGKIFAGFAMNPDMTSMCMEMGAGMLACSSDIGIISNGSASASADIRKTVGREPSQSNKGNADSSY